MVDNVEADGQSILTSSARDFLVRNNGDEVHVSDLVGKHILLYFSAHWCPPCRMFTPKLVEAYNEIKSKHDAFEVIFISSDVDQPSYDEYFATMPWLALPYNDERKDSLKRLFKVNGIPFAVALCPTGEMLTNEAFGLITLHGAKAFPFTDERVAEIEAGFVDMVKGWPEKVKHDLHQKHELVLSRFRVYLCDGCHKDGTIWAYSCRGCDFDLHLECAVEKDNVKTNEVQACDEEDCQVKVKPNAGQVCDG